MPSNSCSLPWRSATARPANIHLYSKASGHRGFAQQRAISGICVCRIDDLDVIRLVFCHELIARHAISHPVHDGPLDRGCIPTTLSFLGRQVNRRSATDIHMQRVISYVNARPHNLTWLGDSPQGTSTIGKVHRRLPAPVGFLPASKMCRWCRAADLEHPDVIFHRSRSIPITPPNVMESRFNRLV